MACGLIGLAAVLVTGRVEAVDSEPMAEEAWVRMREQTFSTVWETINTSYHDSTFDGVDWVAVREKYRPELATAADKPALRAVLQRMLGELGQTHFAILPREMSVYTPAERVRIGTVGAEVAAVEGGVAVVEVRPDSPAAQAGLRPGDEIVRVGDQELAPIKQYLDALGQGPARTAYYLTDLVASRLRAGVGTAISLGVRHGAEETVREVSVVSAAHDGEWSEPVGSFPSLPLASRAHVDPDGLAYLRFNVFARQVMPAIRALLRDIPADGGLVLDLRGNPGGITVMASGITGWLSDRVFAMGTMQMRQGRINFMVAPQKNAFLGPVAVLIDSGSASTSEIMAAGLQEAGRARIFGEPSPGAALPSIVKELPSGDMLQYAIADLHTPAGVMIEGVGVFPDVMVTRTRADLAAGRDPVLAAARGWLESARKKSGGRAP